MRYSLTIAFLLAAVIFPAWCDSREETYDPESAALSHQMLQDSHEAYPTQKQSPDRKNYYYQQNETPNYAVAQEHSQPSTYPPINHQYRAQAPRQLHDEAALASASLRMKGSCEESVEEDKGERNMAYHQMKQGGNNFGYYQRPNMMMNAPRQTPQFPPNHKLLMEQQMQMQMQLQRRQQMQQQMAAAQAQAFLNQQQQQQQQQAQQQHFAQHSPQQYAQPPAQQQYPQQHYQPPAPAPSQPSPQVDSYLASRAAPPPVKAHYNPTPSTPKAHYAPPQTTPQPWAQAQPQQGYYEEYEHPRQKE